MNVLAKPCSSSCRSLRPPLPESDITREETALDAAIAEIEERYGPQELPLASPTPSRL